MVKVKVRQYFIKNIKNVIIAPSSPFESLSILSIPEKLNNKIDEMRNFSLSSVILSLPDQFIQFIAIK